MRYINQSLFIQQKNTLNGKLTVEFSVTKAQSRWKLKKLSRKKNPSLATETTIPFSIMTFSPTTILLNLNRFISFAQLKYIHIYDTDKCLLFEYAINWSINLSILDYSTFNSFYSWLFYCFNFFCRTQNICVLNWVF